MKSDTLREHIEKRTYKTLVFTGHRRKPLRPSEKKTPSQCNSERGKMRDLHRAKRQGASIEVATVIKLPCDCRGCTANCTFNGDLFFCDVPSHTGICGHCGQKFRYRFIEGSPWVHCVKCRGE